MNKKEQLIYSLKLIQNIFSKSLLKSNIQLEFKIKKSSTMKRKKSKFCDTKKTDKYYMIPFQTFFLIFLSIIVYIVLIQLISYNHVFTLSDLYFLLLNQRTYLIKHYNYLRTLICYYAYRNSLDRIKEIYNHLQKDLKEALKKNQEIFDEIYKSIRNLNKEEKDIFNKLMNEDICDYLDQFVMQYNINCDDFADGIAHYGIYSSSIYTFQLILYIEMDLEKLLYNLDEKGYQYDEIRYRSDQINILYPEDKNLWEEYESMNPFLILNSDNFHSLALLIQQLIQSVSSSLCDFYKNRIIEIVDSLKIKIIMSQILFDSLLIIACYFFLIPRIIKKNREIKEEKNMLNIIPKNELDQILYNEEIRI